MTDAVARDPLAATPEPVDALEASVAAVRARVERLRDFRADSEARLEQAADLLAAARRADGEARAAHAAALAKIAGPERARSRRRCRRTSRASSTTPPTSRARAPGARPRTPSSAGTRRATAARDEARQVEAANRAPIALRDELRRRLDAYRPRRRRLRLLEDPELAALHARAQRVLHTAPTDLARGGRASCAATRRACPPRQPGGRCDDLRAARLQRASRRRLLRRLRDGAPPPSGRRGGRRRVGGQPRARRPAAARCARLRARRHEHAALALRAPQRRAAPARGARGARRRLGAGLVEIPPTPVPRPGHRGARGPRRSPRRAASARAAESRSAARATARPGVRRASAAAAARASRSRRSSRPATSSPASTRSSAASPTAAWAGSTSPGTATSPTAGWCSRACSTRGDDDAMAAALAERRFLAEVEHPNIVRIHNFVQHGSSGYIVMEYVGGTSLKDILEAAARPTAARRSRCPSAQAIAYMLEILPALGYLHDRGLLFCDFKLDNVIQTEHSLKLIDLGGVYRIGDASSPIYGTVGYQAPEIAAGRPDGRLRPVHRRAHARAAVLRLPGLPGQLHVHACRRRTSVPVLQRFDSLYRFLLKATAPDRDDRFQSADEMADQLFGVLREVVAAEDGTTVRRRSSTLFTGDLRADPARADWRRLPVLRVADRRPGGRLPGHALGDRAGRARRAAPRRRRSRRSRSSCGSCARSPRRASGGAALRLLRRDRGRRTPGSGAPHGPAASPAWPRARAGDARAGVQRRLRGGPRRAGREAGARRRARARRCAADRARRWYEIVARHRPERTRPRRSGWPAAAWPPAIVRARWRPTTACRRRRARTRTPRSPRSISSPARASRAPRTSPTCARAASDAGVAHPRPRAARAPCHQAPPGSAGGRGRARRLAGTGERAAGRGADRARPARGPRARLPDARAPSPRTPPSASASSTAPTTFDRGRGHERRARPALCGVRRAGARRRQLLRGLRRGRRQRPGRAPDGAPGPTRPGRRRRGQRAGALAPAQRGCLPPRARRLERRRRGGLRRHLHVGVGRRRGAGGRDRRRRACSPPRWTAPAIWRQRPAAAVAAARTPWSRCPPTSRTRRSRCRRARSCPPPVATACSWSGWVGDSRAYWLGAGEAAPAHRRRLVGRGAGRRGTAVARRRRSPTAAPTPSRAGSAPTRRPTPAGDHARAPGVRPARAVHRRAVECRARRRGPRAAHRRASTRTRRPASVAHHLADVAIASGSARRRHRRRHRRQSPRRARSHEPLHRRRLPERVPRRSARPTSTPSSPSRRSARSASRGPARAAAAEIVIVDASGSMVSPSGKLKAAKQATAAAIDAIRDGVPFGVIAGTEEARAVFPSSGVLAPASAETRAHAKAAVADIVPSGGTAIGTWLTLARQLFDGHAGRPAPRDPAHRRPEPARDRRGARAASSPRARASFQCDCRGVGHRLGGRGAAPDRLGPAGLGRHHRPARGHGRRLPGDDRARDGAWHRRRRAAAVDAAGRGGRPSSSRSRRRSRT